MYTLHGAAGSGSITRTTVRRARLSDFIFALNQQVVNAQPFLFIYLLFSFCVQLFTCYLIIAETVCVVEKRDDHSCREVS